MNIINKYIIISILLFTSLISEAQSDLNEYLEIAVKNNPELKVAFNNYMADLQKVPQVKALPNPNIAFAYLLQPIETRMGPQDYKLSLSQMFPWFGTLKAKENAAEEIAKAKYEVFLNIKSNILNKVKTTYYNLYFNNKASRITRENIKLLKTIQNVALIKVEAGIASASDVYQIEMELNELNNALSQIKDNKIVLTTIFKSLLNINHQVEIHSPELLWENDFQESKSMLLDSIKTGNHQLLSINMQINAIRKKQVLAKKMGMPSFTIGAEYISISSGNQNLSGDDAIILPKIGISIPLYRSKYKAQEKEAYYNEQAKDQQRRNLYNTLDILFEKAWNDYKSSKDKIVLYKSQIEIAKKTLSILETSYSTNNSRFDEYIRMERRLIKYSLALEEARINKHKAISNIESLMGK